MTNTYYGCTSLIGPPICRDRVINMCFTYFACFLNLYPTWKVGVGYSKDDRALYNDVLYKVLLDHTSQSDWAPDVAVSLFTKVLIPDANVTPDWEQPDSTNPYMKGDKVTHNGKVWVSTIDNNVWEPGVYGWEEA